MKRTICAATVLSMVFIALFLFFIRIFASGEADNPAGVDSRIGAEIFIKPGRYFTGSNGEKDNQPLRQRSFTGFFIDVHPVVNFQYARFLARSHYRPEGKFDTRKAEKHPLLPATSLTYADACAYARFHRKRLPTEWEWEIAARSLQKENIYVSGSPPTLETGNFFRYKERNGRTPVFKYPPNALGLYDMAGNVFEWTSSEYRNRDFPGTHQQGHRLMVLRGGAWTNIASDVRATTRTPFPAGRFLGWIGFRCVRDVREDGE